MKPFLKGVVCLFLLLHLQNAGAQESSIVRGVYLWNQASPDLRQLRDSLYLNKAQLDGDSCGVWHTSVLDNEDSVGIYNRQTYLDYQSRAQKLVFQAEIEAGTEMHSYFKTHETGSRDALGDSWQAILGTHGAGYMARDSWPDEDFRYVEGPYKATFLVKSNRPSIPTQNVFSCQVYVDGVLANSVTLRGFQFTAGQWFNVTLSFNVSQSANALASLATGALSGGMRERMASAARSAIIAAHSVDLRMY